jgi:hypothetical protein
VPYFLNGDASLKDVCGAAAIQLIFVGLVPLGPARQAPSLGFVICYCSTPKVFGDWFPPVYVGAGRPNNGRYFSPEFPVLTNWPGWGPRVGTRLSSHDEVPSVSAGTSS